MDWMLFDVFFPPPLGWRKTTGPQKPAGSEPTEADLWVTAATYEFVAMRSMCVRCGAGLRRKVGVAVVPGTPWLIAVSARCRGWRRHGHIACVAERHGGLRFGELRPI